MPLHYELGNESETPSHHHHHHQQQKKSFFDLIREVLIVLGTQGLLGLGKGKTTENSRITDIEKLGLYTPQVLKLALALK